MASGSVLIGLKRLVCLEAKVKFKDIDLQTEADFASYYTGFSLKLFVLCLKRQTASIPTLASKGNPLSCKIAHEFKDDLNDDSVRKGLLEYRKKHGISMLDCDDLAKTIIHLSRYRNVKGWL
ncbi:hypothetical protein EG329_007431 [Mollisiaceae sp. DMI_Dod_QoI]|nr:hypothetical protein EG329_007431 [Helotiales sp. DMI_Dod_QoI]